ncbi:MAG: S8 family serine peptidase, partial [Thermodesulfobacteriota bacterium]
MTEENEQKKSHFLLGNLARPEPFRPKSGGNSANPPSRERKQHGNHLLGQIQQLKPVMDEARQIQESVGLEAEGIGLRLEFESFDDVELAFDSLARERSGIELFNIRQDKELTCATVFVPDGKLVHFENLITDYLNEKRDKNGALRDNHKLINTIKEIHEASLQALWTDDESLFPQQDDESFWWEVWLPRRKDREKEVNTFRSLAEVQGMDISRSVLEFPERTVLQVHASKRQMQQSIMTLNSIAELRRAKETAEFFDALPPEEQPEWVNELLGRCKYTDKKDDAPHVCLLDTGINHMHPLISPALDSQDLHTVEPAWGLDDQEGHGSAMAGVALFG